MNAGKQFEKDFVESIPSHIYRYRLRDGTANFAGASNENVRFQMTNICDFFVHNGQDLFMLELKSHKGKSIPIKLIRKNQLEGLLKAYQHENVYSFLVVNFRDVERTFALSIDHVMRYTSCNPDKKSIPISYFEQFGELIPQQKKKVHYGYDVVKLFACNTKEGTGC